MSKHTISGGADFLEALLFTGLIAYFLKFGLHTAENILGNVDVDLIFQCSAPIDKSWYFLLVPLTSLAWSVLFTPLYEDLPLMTMHGILSYVVYWAISRIPGNNETLGTFIAAMTVTTSAGLVSRFTGRQALGDTVTGLYVLLPGAYLAKGLFFNTADNKIFDGSLLSQIVVMAVMIGLGGWTGTMLCSPTILGTNGGLLSQFTKKRNHDKRSLRLIREEDSRSGAMLFF